MSTKKLPPVEPRGRIEQVASGGWRVTMFNNRVGYFTTEAAAQAWLEDQSR